MLKNLNQISFVNPKIREGLPEKNVDEVETKRAHWLSKGDPGVKSVRVL